ncbi:DNA-processing protein DprA [Alkalihalobacillus sp. 1P02AB]|uniref:DNA-processing protein DprA n=1 Tax=Alkalihalobacillus sp. 1P02AB TaxID=3132260 RepID=UPI0039A6A7C4
MSQIRQKIIHLHFCRGVSNAKCLKILKKDPQLEQLPTLSVHDLQQIYRFSPKQASHFYEDYHRFYPEQVVEFLAKYQIEAITMIDEDYPLLLKEIYDPPLVLYTIGKKELLKRKMIAAVGTRQPTQLGKRSVALLLPPLIEQNWTIISGLAKGIDAIAHQATIKAGGKTIAVLGSGFFHPYPKENLSLYEYIKKEQLVISEYPPYCPPKRWQFPARNRIISGLSYGVIVVEAKEKSGSLITADQALEQGREVFAVPGPIYESQSLGTNYLIQQGAKLVVNANDILNELPSVDI